MRLAHFALPLALLLPACSSAESRGGQTGEESAGCFIVKSTVLAEGEKSPSGQTGADVLSTVEAPLDSTLWWSAEGEPEDDGRNTPLHFTFEASGPARWVEEEFQSDSAQELAIDCQDYVEVRGQLTMTSDDGAFDESWSTRLQGYEPKKSSVFAPVVWDELSGSFDFGQLVPTGEQPLPGTLQVNFRSTSAGNDIQGKIMGQSERSQGDAVSARSIAVGRIGKAGGEW